MNFMTCMMIVVFARKVVRLQYNYKTCLRAKFQSPVTTRSTYAMSDRAKKTVWSKYFEILGVLFSKNNSNKKTFMNAFRCHSMVNVVVHLNNK